MSEETSAATQYLSFILAQEEYALGILRVKEIIEYDTVTRVPGAPVWVRGVFNLRGSGVPVVDLTVKLDLPPIQLTRRGCIVVEVLSATALRALPGQDTARTTGKAA